MLTVIILFLSGVVFTVLAVRLLLKKRLLVSSVNGTVGISLLSTATILSLVLFNLHTYDRLTSERLLAVVEIGVKTTEGIPINLIQGQSHQTFYINAREWQLDGKFLKWKYWTYLLGKEPIVRLESLSERYPFDERRVPVHYPLAKDVSVFSEWGSALSDWIGLVDTYYGSAVYMPVNQGSTYTVSATTTGLIARADNLAAKKALTEWMSQ